MKPIIPNDILDGFLCSYRTPHDIGMLADAMEEIGHPEANVARAAAAIEPVHVLEGKKIVWLPVYGTFGLNGWTMWSQHTFIRRLGYRMHRLSPYKMPHYWCVLISGGASGSHKASVAGLIKTTNANMAMDLAKSKWARAKLASRISATSLLDRFECKQMMRLIELGKGANIIPTSWVTSPLPGGGGTVDSSG